MIKKQKSSKRFIKINPANPEPDIILTAARVIKQGGIVAFPTRNLYGLAADALSADAAERVFEIKQRPPTKPLLILIKDQKELGRIVREIPPAAVCLMAHFWPGKITIILKASDTLPANLTGGSGRIGIRLPAHRVASALVKAVDVPITGTSANISGKTGCSRVSDFDSSIISKLDLILDAGPLKEGPGSTIIDIKNDGIRILREGAVSAEDIFSVLPKAFHNKIFPSL